MPFGVWCVVCVVFGVLCVVCGVRCMVFGVLCVVCCVWCLVCCLWYLVCCVWLVVCSVAHEEAVIRRAVQQCNRICNKWTSSWQFYGLLWYDAVSIGTYLTSFGVNRASSTGEIAVATEDPLRCGNFRSHDERLGHWVLHIPKTTFHGRVSVVGG